MLQETKSERRRNLLDVIAPAGVLRLAAGRVRPRICLGENMVGSSGVRAVANLGIASALTIFLGACRSMSLPSFSSSPSVAPEPAPVPEMPATIRADEIVGRWGLASFQNPNDRARTEVAARAQCKQPYVIGAGANGGVIMHLADQATPQELRLKGSPERQELYRPARAGRRRTGSRDRLFRRACPDHPLHRQGCGDPLRQHGLCPLRAARVT